MMKLATAAFAAMSFPLVGLADDRSGPALLDDAEMAGIVAGTFLSLESKNGRDLFTVIDYGTGYYEIVAGGGSSSTQSLQGHPPEAPVQGMCNGTRGGLVGSC